MTEAVLINMCFLIFCFWSLIDITFHLSFYFYCAYILPWLVFAFILKSSNSKKRESKDVCLQTDFESVTMKDSFTSTDDNHGYGDVDKDTLNSTPQVSIDFEKSNLVCSNPVIDNIDVGCNCNDSGVITVPSPNAVSSNNRFISQETNQTGPNLFFDLPEIDNALFEVEEQELIDIFENSSFNNNPFEEEYVDPATGNSLDTLHNPDEKSEYLLENLDEEESSTSEEQKLIDAFEKACLNNNPFEKEHGNKRLGASLDLIYNPYQLLVEDDTPSE